MLRRILTKMLADQSIGCGRYRQPNVSDTPFSHLSRGQQIEELEKMLETGVDVEEIKNDLYLVANKTTDEVWRAFIFLR